MIYHKVRLLNLATMLFLVLCCYGLPNQQVLAARIIKLEAEKFRFNPDTIEVRQGEDIELHIISKDRLHGFSLPDLNLHGDIVPGKILKIKFIAERSGKYGFLCNIFCGSGHGDMQGQILVLPDP